MLGIFFPSYSLAVLKAKARVRTRVILHRFIHSSMHSCIHGFNLYTSMCTSV